MRVVALEYRAAHVRNGATMRQNKMFGARGAVDLVTTPIAAGSGSWDVKRILGEVPVRITAMCLWKFPPKRRFIFNYWTKTVIAFKRCGVGQR
jgi:hypothetical protein